MLRFIHSHRLAVPAVAVALGFAGTAHANLVTNGDFEDTTGWGENPGEQGHPPGWEDGLAASAVNPAGQQEGANAIGGSGTSAYLSSTVGGTLRNAFTESSSDFNFSVDFASEDPGTLRSFTGSLQNAAGGSFITFRIVDMNGGPQGDIQFFSGGWQSVAGLNDSVIFDADVQTTPLVHSFLIDGNFDEASPNYDVTIINSAGATFTANGLTLFNSATPTADDGIEVLNFHGPASIIGGDYVIDNVSLENTVIPEPASVLLLAGGACLFFRRRR